MDFLLPLQMGTTGCPEMSVINYQPTPLNIIPAEQRPQDKLLSGGGQDTKTYFKNFHKLCKTQLHLGKVKLYHSTITTYFHIS
jgi:hypothetical protein